jgi:uridine kinase
MRDPIFAVQRILDAVHRAMNGRTTPILVALDGRSGGGKSTVALSLANSLDACIVPSDDFFAAEISDAQWNARGGPERARDAIDWRRLRRDALEPLLSGKTAAWQAFDFEEGTRPDGTYAMRADFVRREPARVIILEGAYSTRPELSDLIDLSVLIDAPARIRHRRLAAREEATFLAAWHARWDVAEEFYFTHVRPPSSFDLVVEAGGEPGA